MLPAAQTGLDLQDVMTCQTGWPWFAPALHRTIFARQRCPMTCRRAHVACRRTQIRTRVSTRVDSCLRTGPDHTIVNPLAASRAAKTAASTLEDVARVRKEKYADDATNMGATFAPLVCSVYGLLQVATPRCDASRRPRASDAHVNRVGGRKAFINLLLSAVSCSIQKRNGVIIHTALQKILAKS
jgi:hypothetical protein